MKKLSLLLIFLFLCIYSSFSLAKIHYVSNDGSSAGDGSLTNPYSKISTAYNAAVSNGQNEVIKLLPGIHTETNTLVFDYNNITISGYGDQSIISNNIIVKSKISFADLYIQGTFSNENYTAFNFNNVKCSDNTIDVEAISGQWRGGNDKMHINYLSDPSNALDAVNLESMNTYVQGSLTTFVDESELVNETWVENYVGNNAVAADGSTMTGYLTLSGDPTQALHAATKQYVDDKSADSPLYDAIIGYNEPDLYSAFTNGAKTIFVPEGVHTSAFPASIILTGETRIKGAGKGISKLYVELTGGEMLFSLNSGFREVLFEDVDIIITNKSTTSYFVMFYNNQSPDTYAAYRFRNCYFQMHDNGNLSHTYVVKLDNHDKNELEMFNVDADITANGFAFLFSAIYNFDREIGLIIWDSVVNITAGRTMANSQAGICTIDGRSKDSIIDMRNVICNISGDINTNSRAIFFRKQGTPSNIKKCVMNNVIINSPNTCMDIEADIDMFRSSDCSFNGPKGIWFRGNAYSQYITNAIISSTSFKCSNVCIDFDDDTAGRSDPVVIDNCKFNGTPTNSGCMTRLLWGNNEVNGTFQIVEGQTNDWNGETLHNIGEPAVSNDAATMFYVDSQVQTVSTGIIEEARIDNTITRDSELDSAIDDCVQINNSQTMDGPLAITSTSDVGGSGTGGALILGDPNSSNIRIDNNEIEAFNNTTPSTLHFQVDGGEVKIGTHSTADLDVSGSIKSAETTSGSSTDTVTTKGYVDDSITGVTNNIYVEKNGDIMTGQLSLSGAPTNDLHAATKKYVDDCFKGFDYEARYVYIDKYYDGRNEYKGTLQAPYTNFYHAYNVLGQASFYGISQPVVYHVGNGFYSIPGVTPGQDEYVRVGIMGRGSYYRNIHSDLSGYGSSVFSELGTYIDKFHCNSTTGNTILHLKDLVISNVNIYSSAHDEIYCDNVVFLDLTNNGQQVFHGLYYIGQMNAEGNYQALISSSIRPAYFEAVQSSNNAAFVHKSGDTMTGTLKFDNFKKIVFKANSQNRHSIGIPGPDNMNVLSLYGNTYLDFNILSGTTDAETVGFKPTPRLRISESSSTFNNTLKAPQIDITSASDWLVGAIDRTGDIVLQHEDSAITTRSGSGNDINLSPDGSGNVVAHSNMEVDDRLFLGEVDGEGGEIYFAAHGTNPVAVFDVQSQYLRLLSIDSSGNIREVEKWDLCSGTIVTQAIIQNGRYVIPAGIFDD